MQDGSTLPAPEFTNRAASSSYGGTQAPTVPTNESSKVLPFSITSAVFQALRGAPPAYTNMGLSHSYPAGSFEAIEALTFVTDPSWQKALVQEVTKPYFRDLWVTITRGYIQNAVEGERVAPPTRSLLFNAFNLTPLEKVKVVIFCHGPITGKHCNSDGLAWSVHPSSSKLPSCTSHLFKLLKRYNPDFKPPGHGSLQQWAKQGVLLLNIALISCSQRPEPGPGADKLSHFAPFWRGVLEILKTHCKHLVLLALRDPAQTMDYVKTWKEVFLGQENVAVVYGSWQIDEINGCYGNCFSTVNAALATFEEDGINWTDLGTDAVT